MRRSAEVKGRGSAKAEGRHEARGKNSTKAGLPVLGNGRRRAKVAASEHAPDYRAIARSIERWFHANARELPWRDAYVPWHVWISEVMAQQTRMEVVVARFPEFVARFPTIESLARAREDDVVAAWSGLGYYRRARMLHRGAREVMARFGGELPADAEALRSIPGIGRYSAGSIASVAFGLREAIVDGNVARVVARLEMIDAPLRSGAHERRAWEIAGALVAESQSPRDLNQGLMEFGARVCTPRNPACGECPLTVHCAAFEADRVGDYPTRSAGERPAGITIPLYVFTDGTGRVLFRRAEGKLMQGMLHLPHGNDALYPDPLRISRPGPVVGTVKHSITSRRITFEVYTPPPTLGRVADVGGDWLWLVPEELAKHAHPSYVAKVMTMLRSSSVAASRALHDGPR